MKARTRITQTTLKLLKADENSDTPVIMWDAETKGFGVKFNPKTRHTSFVAKRGNVVRVIGAADVLSVEQARTLARTVLQELRGGIDRKAVQVAERKAAEDQAQRDLTFGFCLTDYTNRGRIKPESAAFYLKLAKRHLGDLWDRPVRSITGRTVIDKFENIIAAVAKGGRGNGIGTAAICTRIVSLAYNHAAVLGVEGLGINPCMALRGDRRRVMQPRTDHIQLDRLRDFWDALGRLPTWQTADRPVADFPAADVLKLIVLTGLRKSNARALRWEQCDMERNVIRFAASEMKAGRALDLPMHPLVVVLLKQRSDKRRFYNGGCEFVFPQGSGHAVNLSPAMADAIKLAGIDHCTVHGLRRTFASAAFDSGVGLDAVGMLLSHSRPSGVTGNYIRSVDATMARAVATVGAYLANALGLTGPAGNVVALPKRAAEPDAVPAADRTPAAMTA